MSEENSAEDRDMQAIDAACEALALYFDHIQIFVSRHESDQEGCITASGGSGNFLARKGQVRDWLLKQDQFVRMEAEHDILEGEE